uniref:Putative secreted protein n=1 Tax=Lutzomyia longipalpis TaxID=7200 RepID=A0A7G3AM88_LUTLO
MFFFLLQILHKIFHLFAYSLAIRWEGQRLEILHKCMYICFVSKIDFIEKLQSSAMYSENRFINSSVMRERFSF